MAQAAGAKSPIGGAVEEAMAGLDRIDADQVGGAAAATQVAAIVGSDRFAVDD